MQKPKPTAIKCTLNGMREQKARQRDALLTFVAVVAGRIHCAWVSALASVDNYNRITMALKRVSRHRLR